MGKLSREASGIQSGRARQEPPRRPPRKRSFLNATARVFAAALRASRPHGSPEMTTKGRAVAAAGEVHRGFQGVAKFCALT